ncbi:hypothetical protein Tco_0623067 [Tanacetum coccineum]
MSLSSSSSHATVTYTSESSDDDLPSWGIPLMEAYESNLKATTITTPISLNEHSALFTWRREEEEGHLAPADSTLSVPDSVPSAKETEPFETDESAATPLPPRSPQTYTIAPTPPSLPPAPLSPLSSPLLLIPSPPLPLPSPDCRGAILEADMLSQKRICFTAPSYSFEIKESLAAATARQTRPTLAHVVDYLFIDALDASIKATDERVITAIEMVNERMTDLAATLRHDNEEFYIQARYACQAWAHSEDRSQAMEAQIKALQDEVRALQAETRVLQRQRIDDGVADALVDYEANRSNGNGDDSHNSRSGRRRPVPTARVCTYKDFLNCQPINFKGTEGVNSHVKTVGHDAAYGMPWKTLMKMMTDKYCPRSEIKKLEIEIWNLKVKGTDVVSYTQRFQELDLMCGRMFPKESDEVEKYIGRLPDMIQGNVMSARPKIKQEAIELANDLMDQKVYTFTERQAENKRKLDNNPKYNQVQQQPFKR